MAFKGWRTLLLFVTSALASFENTGIVRTAELGGSVVHVTTNYAIKALEDKQKVYTVVLGRDEKARTSWIESTLKGNAVRLTITERRADPSDEFHLVDIVLPKALDANKTANVVLETMQTHATWPCPSTAAQADDQALKYKTDLFVLSPYPTVSQRTRIKTHSPRIISYTTPEDVNDFAPKEPVSKSGATLLYGPYDNLPPSSNRDFIAKYQQPVLLHYNHDQPVLEVLSLNRSVEISHWGANLNTEDKLVLHNAGPKLKGHFSRIEYQTQRFQHKLPAHILPTLTLPLPPGVRNAYYYDLIGNVSTSALRVAPSPPKNSPVLAFSTLELSPRYPLLGGWNYSFTIGWDSPLADAVSYDRSTGRYIVEVPIVTPIGGAVINEEELTVVLPEGATDVEFIEPFASVASRTGTHTTYLDTIGRPQLTFQYRNLTPKHAEVILVSYRLAWSAHLRKPLAVGITFFSCFVFAMIARRVNLTLHKKRSAS